MQVEYLPSILSVNVFPLGPVFVTVVSASAIPTQFHSGPGINNVDLSIFKNFKFNERSSLEFRIEFFNAFNHTQFLLSGNSSTVFGFNPSFGRLTQARDLRIIQFALKLSF